MAELIQLSFAREDKIMQQYSLNELMAILEAHFREWVSVPSGDHLIRASYNRGL